MSTMGKIDWMPEVPDRLAVILPFTTREARMTCENLELMWYMQHKGRNKSPCFLTCENNTDAEALEEVIVWVKRVFHHWELFQYEPWAGSPNTGPWAKRPDLAAGPNHAWKNSVREYCSRRWPLSFFWWEQDAIPLKPDWLEVLWQEYRRGGKPCAGHVVGGMEHMNGVAIYPPDLWNYTTNGFTCVKTAFDIAMKKDLQRHIHPINHLILHYWNIHEGQNYNGPLGKPLTIADRSDLEKWTTPESVVLHRCKDGSATRVLTQIYAQKYFDKKEADKAARAAKRAEDRLRRKAERAAAKDMPATQGEDEPAGMAAATGTGSGTHAASGTAVVSSGD